MTDVVTIILSNISGDIHFLQSPRLLFAKTLNFVRLCAVHVMKC